jgi:hypothetical protein
VHPMGPLNSLQSQILQLHSVQQQLALAHGMALAGDSQSRALQAALGAAQGIKLPHQGSVLPGASMRELLPDVGAGGSTMPAAASLQSPGELQQQLMQVRAGAGYF